MLFSDIIRYYSSDSVKDRIIAAAKQREVVARFNDKVGARPDVLSYNADIAELVKKGATSFHASLERWSNPMNLAAAKTKKDLDTIRTGWDFIIDIDTKQVEYAKICAKLLCDALEFHSVSNYSIKFSGGTGFHIGIPFESFPREINGSQTALQFPEGARMIAAYLKQMIRQTLADKILEFEDIKQICRRTGKQFKELVAEGEFDPYKVLEIDTIAISSRHLMRMPYVFNEKTWKISIPLRKKDLDSFKPEMADARNVTTELGYLDKFKKDEARQLFIEAFDWNMKEQLEKNEDIIKKEFELPKEAIPAEFFPPCIKNIYNGMEEGRKRALFILINFLRSCGWGREAIEADVLKWNQKNPKPLAEGYVRGQLGWHGKLKDKYLPPACTNENFYKDIGICRPDTFCANIKNPVVYPFRRMKAAKKK
ncbi:MAG: hypothetical protein PHC66_01740 [Candidatus Nanoarchaeia archaeon]|nr:hypothetical protein [Candidatus Nanoarchaeia archaeon]MDD5238934.1 hypothetical protein [Candidatus Nanoarchaeia archaeon]